LLIIDLVSKKKETPIKIKVDKIMLGRLKRLVDFIRRAFEK